LVVRNIAATSARDRTFLRSVGKRVSVMQSSDECVIVFPVVGGIFGVARLATKLNELLDKQQIGPGASVNGSITSIPRS
jgi:hypothetical protein